MRVRGDERIQQRDPFALRHRAGIQIDVLLLREDAVENLENGADMIEKAAKISGVKKSAFLREAALEKAAHILAAVG